MNGVLACALAVCEFPCCVLLSCSCCQHVADRPWLFTFSVLAVWQVKKIRNALDASSGPSTRTYNEKTGLLAVPGSRCLLIPVGELTGNEAPEKTDRSVLGPKFEAS